MKIGEADHHDVELERIDAAAEVALLLAPPQQFIDELDERRGDDRRFDRAPQKACL